MSFSRRFSPLQTAAAAVKTAAAWHPIALRGCYYYVSPLQIYNLSRRCEDIGIIADIGVWHRAQHQPDRQTTDLLNVTSVSPRYKPKLRRKASGFKVGAAKGVQPGVLWSILTRYSRSLKWSIRSAYHSFCLTPSTPAVPNRCSSKGSASYWSNPLFLIFDIRALWRSVLSARAPECQKLKIVD